MGVAAMVVGTLFSSWMQGRAQQAQAEAAARQSEQNAQIAQMNADKAQEIAERQDENNKINAENERRRALLRMGQQRAAIGASGVTASGSAAAALADTGYAINEQTGMSLYNGRQQVDNMLQQSTDFQNQSNFHSANASDYRAAGRRAMMNSMLTGAFSLASNLYTGVSSASQQTAEAAGTQVGSFGGRDWSVGLHGWGGKGTSFGSHIGNYNARGYGMPRQSTFFSMR